MGLAQENTTVDHVSSVMRWWRDAGVDVMIDEQPRSWLSVAVAKSGRPAVIAPPKIERQKTLGSLVEWLMTSEEFPELGPVQRRVGPSGDPACGLMVLTDLPETADVDSGKLFAGELASLFDNMLGALGRDRGSIYLASLSAGRPPSGRLSAAALKSLSEKARDHVKFIAPKRLWTLGSAASCAILGMTDVEAHGKLHSINLDGVIVDVVATAHPRILNSKEKKLRAWANMQRLIEKDEN
jgi:uracil-DNA glycosylase family 4